MTEQEENDERIHQRRDPVSIMVDHVHSKR
jgi:hypothetical protein